MKLRKRTKRKFVSFLLILVIGLIGYGWNHFTKKGSTNNLPAISNITKAKPKTDKKADKSDKSQAQDKTQSQQPAQSSSSISSINPDQLPEFDGKTPFIAVNDNVPTFTDEEKSVTKSFEHYSELDGLGRVGVSYANLSRDTMPAKGEKRGSISNVKPSGWGTYKFKFVDGGYLYNRSHMIGWQLSAENDNKLNLATGTRYFNVDGMLPFEDLVADYIKETGNHVLYRVTPVFVGDELVMRGLQMEAFSVEDKGAGVSYNVYVYNAQPGVYIDYLTGMATAQ